MGGAGRVRSRDWKEQKGIKIDVTAKWTRAGMKKGLNSCLFAIKIYCTFTTLYSRTKHIYITCLVHSLVLHIFHTSKEKAHSYLLHSHFISLSFIFTSPGLFLFANLTDI